MPGSVGCCWHYCRGSDWRCRLPAAKTLNDYKNGARKHPTMRGIAAALSEQDMADLEHGGDAGPGEEEVEDAEAVAAEVEVVDSEAAEEDGEEDSDDLVATGLLVLGVEPGALLVGHVGGVDGIGGLHDGYSPEL